MNFSSSHSLLIYSLKYPPNIKLQVHLTELLHFDGIFWTFLFTGSASNTFFWIDFVNAL